MRVNPPNIVGTRPPAPKGSGGDMFPAKFAAAVAKIYEEKTQDESTAQNEQDIPDRAINLD